MYKKISVKSLKKFYSKRPSVTLTETAYNTNVIFPCIKAMLVMMKKKNSSMYRILFLLKLNLLR
ncbi:hypothetical protein BD770DRAFT_116935 [Pilaira anomala]|nr:hypothetical protein BD770DRAFT_116935 [Pilaira anomala]